MTIINMLKKTTFLTLVTFVIACGGASGSTDDKSDNKPSPYTDNREHVVLDHAKKRTVRADADKTISRPERMRNKRNCFIVISKKDFYLYVYEAQGADTVMLARYDCCLSMRKGNKQRPGDMKTPASTMARPFTISQMQPSSSWSHDFRDGRGNIPSYGAWFLRLRTPGHNGIGIHGSTNNRESVPGRASEGCIRLLDEDIIDLKQNYAFVEMKVVIKDEKVDDLPFERKALKDVKRVRHFDPAKTLTNEQIAMAKPEKFTPQRKGNQYAETEEEVTTGNYEELYGGPEEFDGEDDVASAVPQTPATPRQQKRNKSLDQNMTLEELNANGY